MAALPLSPASSALDARPVATHPGAVTGAPRGLLRLEGAAALALAIAAYVALGGSMGWFFAFFLAPDLSFLGYLFGRRVGTVTYNAAHTYLLPAGLALVAYVLHAPAVLLGACIWTAHVGFDRMLGYGLKYASAFGDTHLGRSGRR